VRKLDDLVAPADEPENTVLVDQSRLIRWVGLTFALFSVVMVPWIVYIAVSLPSRQLSPNYGKRRILILQRRQAPGREARPGGG
jgi:hypothetical protein